MKAQIKMRLNTSGVPIVVIRSFQLLQKKSALQFKAIDQVGQATVTIASVQTLSTACCNKRTCECALRT